MKNSTALKDKEEPFTIGYAKYRKIHQYKYQTHEIVVVYTPVIGYHIVTPFIELHKNGMVIIQAYYCWDGPSGPTYDTPAFIWASLPHDVFYQLMRMGILPQKERLIVDKFLRIEYIKYCKNKTKRQRAMSKLRSWWIYCGVRSWWGKRAAQPKPEPKIYETPKIF